MKSLNVFHFNLTCIISNVLGSFENFFIFGKIKYCKKIKENDIYSKLIIVKNGFGKPSSNLVKDIIIISKTKEQNIRITANKLIEIRKNIGLNINEENTKYLIISR